MQRGRWRRIPRAVLDKLAAVTDRTGTEGVVARRGRSSPSAGAQTVHPRDAAERTTHIPPVPPAAIVAVMAAAPFPLFRGAAAVARRR